MEEDPSSLQGPRTEASRPLLSPWDDQPMPLWRPRRRIAQSADSSPSATQSPPLHL